MTETTAARAAFAPDARLQRVRAAGKAAWWGLASRLSQTLIRPDHGEQAVRFETDAPRPDAVAVRRLWAEAFDKDAADVAAGLYPPMDAEAPRDALTRTLDVFLDAKAVDARRRRAAGQEARADAPSAAYPPYYRQNFHYQSGGWFTPQSARRYEAQVELLFAGTAAAMRRRALSLLARAWRARDQRELTVLDLACGAGGFMADLRRAFPRATFLGADLSAAYLEQARVASGAKMTQANAERLPFADGSLDAVTCVYLFHELPPKVRLVVAAEIARVLKPGGLLAFADAVQPHDVPDMRRMLEAFPAYFHEPYFDSFCRTDLDALFGEAGLEGAGVDQAFLTKARLYRKP